MTYQLAPEHPAVVLRSRYLHLRALLAVALSAIVALTVAVVILATADGGTTSASSAQPLGARTEAAPAQRSDGGPEESATAAAIGTRVSGTGPDESATAAAIGSGPEPTPAPSRPDESAVAAAISGP
jgi:hypothetical protein